MSRPIIKCILSQQVLQENIYMMYTLSWREECKGLYYLRTETSHRAENVSEKVKLNKLKDYSEVKDTEEDREACQIRDSNGCTGIQRPIAHFAFNKTMVQRI